MSSGHVLVVEMKQYFLQLVLYLMEKYREAARLLFNAAAPFGRKISNYRVGIYRPPAVR
jgi:hypothetical protein